MLRFENVAIVPSRINTKRDELVAYIGNNPENLSLYCDGNCYAHDDALVLWCHRQLTQTQQE